LLCLLTLVNIFCFYPGLVVFLRRALLRLFVVNGPLGQVLLACQVAWQAVLDAVTRPHVADVASVS